MPPAFDPAFALSLVDLTSLNATDTQADIVRLAQQGVTALGPVAGLCIYPRFVPVAKAALQTARINLGHTRVTAPIAGRIGRARVAHALARHVEAAEIAALYRDFLALRLSGSWEDAVLPALEAWDHEFLAPSIARRRALVDEARKDEGPVRRDRQRLGTQHEREGTKPQVEAIERPATAASVPGLSATR